MSDRCSAHSRARCDVLAGTAIPTQRFLLIEEPGSWGPQAHPTGALPAAVVSHVHAVANELSARMLLIRRAGRQAITPERMWAVADVGTGEIRWGSAESVDALAEADFLGGGHGSAAPAFLICAQGRHDVCCALEGRPVAAAFDARLPESSWECSHIGGDRFAANVLTLPSGLVYGRVSIHDVDRLIAAQADGLIVPDLLRGRCGTAPVGQVAEAHVRKAWHELRERTIAIDSVEHLDHEVWRVSGRHTLDSRRFSAELVESHLPVDSGLTCAAVGPGRLRTWTLVGIESS